MPKLSEILTSKELLESLDLGISSAADNDLLDRLDEVFQALEHRDAEMDKLMSLISDKNKLAAMIKSDIIERIKRESESWHRQCRDHSQIFTKHICLC